MIAVFAFSDRGEALAHRIADVLPDAYVLRPRGDLAARAAEAFAACGALIFVGAAGIAVRAIAPYVADKTRDPAVLVIDERAKHAVSLLSGHIGGANALTLQVAATIGAEPVVTTATDVNRRFSVDAWAARHGLRIGSMDEAKRFSAGILVGDMPLCSDFPIEGELPNGVYIAREGACGAAITCFQAQPFAHTLRLTPQIVHLGIGCRRGTPKEKIEKAADALKLCPEAIRSVASIDVKRDEAGLLAFCEARGLPTAFYSAQELERAQGTFSSSEFVQKTVGVDNVCERSAVLAAGDGAQLIVRKTCLDGVTVAAAAENWRVEFE